MGTALGAAFDSVLTMVRRIWPALLVLAFAALGTGTAFAEGEDNREPTSVERLQARLAAKKAAAEAGISIRVLGSEEVNADLEAFRTTGSQLAIVVPYPLDLTYPAAGVTMLANAAVVWATPNDPTELEQIDAVKDPTERLERAASVLDRISDLTIYAEGPVWLRYGAEEAASTVRADRLILSVRKGEANPEGGFSFVLSGAVENARAHTSEEAAKALSSVPGSEVEGLRPQGDEDSAATEPGGINRRAAQEGVRPREIEPDIFSLEKGRRLFLRAQRLRILEASGDASQRTAVEAEDGSITASSLAVPQHAFSSELIQIRLSGTRRIVILKDPGLDVGGSRVFTYPSERYVQDLDSKFPVRRLDLGYSDAFGLSFRTRVDLISGYDYFWDPEPPFRPFELGPIFEYHSKRGIAYGMEYVTPAIPTFGQGFDASIQGYTIRDRGDRRAVAQTLGYYPLRQPQRGRVRGYARYRGAEGLAIDSHINYESDGTFVEEFFRDEYLSNVQDKTFVRVRRDFRFHSYYVDLTVRARDFRNEIERLPVVGFGIFRQPILPPGLGLYLTADGTFGLYRARIAEPGHPGDDRTVVRGDLSVQVNRPLDFGFMTIDPYLGFRVTGADTRYNGVAGGNPLYDPVVGYQPLAGDPYERRAVGRAMLLYGASAQTTLSRTWRGVRSGTLDVHGLRHVMTPQVRWENALGPDGRAERFMQMDEVDALERGQRFVLSLRNRIQIRRASDDLAGARTVDLLDLLVEVPWYPARQRDNAGQGFGEIEFRGVSNALGLLQLRAGGFIEPETFNWRRLYAAAAFPIGQTEWTLYARSLRGQHQIIGAALAADLSGTYRLELDQEYDLSINRARDTVLRISRMAAEAIAFDVTFRRNAITQDVSFSFGLSVLFGP